MAETLGADAPKLLDASTAHRVDSRMDLRLSGNGGRVRPGRIVGVVQSS